jgi:crossover junction endodeoxyribonuclease RuvC
MKSAGRTHNFLRVLGVDPAAAGRTGYGIIESDGRRSQVVHYGALPVAGKNRNGRSGAEARAGNALRAVHEKICNLIREFEPHVLALESVFTALNMRTALRLAEVRGVVLLAASQHGLEVHSYAPREIKASVAGFGHADKRQMQLMVRAMLAMRETPDPADAADALAVALCHILKEEMRAKFDIPRDAPAGVKSRVADCNFYGAHRVQFPRFPATR